MCGTKVLRSLVALLAAVLVVFGLVGPTMAQTQSASSDQEARLRILQERIDALAKELKDLQAEQAKTAQTVATTTKTVETTAKTVSKSESRFNDFMKGFFGTLDASIDYTTKGENGMQAFPYALAPGVISPNGPFVLAGGPKAPPFGRVGWLAALSSNGSNVGYRGTHHIDGTNLDFIYQVAAAIDMVAAPGLQNTWTKSSNVVQGAIGLGDTYLGFQGKQWGKLKVGELYMPYKSSTDRLNYFAGTLGGYNVIVSNTGGDNRVEFGTRMDHVILFNSPNFEGLSFDLAYALGQNLDSNSNLMPLGSADCAGGNIPGSGNLPLNCDDGGFQDAYSADIKFEKWGFYGTAAYERHKKVNRASDGVGSNNPYYNYVLGLGPNNPLSAQLLNWGDYQAFQAEFPEASLAGTPEYNAALDTADEWALKIGGEYRFDFGLSIAYLWEGMHRDLPQIMEFQNERQRQSDWLALQYVFNGGADRVAAGWAHASATTGDPGGQHNFNPDNLGKNEGNMYTIGWWHKLDKQLSAYIVAAETMNDGNAHFDIGAGGHGLKTDCHDATHALFIDYSSAGPTTWGGCHPIGISTGVNYKF